VWPREKEKKMAKHGNFGRQPCGKGADKQRAWSREVRRVKYNKKKNRSGILAGDTRPVSFSRRTKKKKNKEVRGWRELTQTRLNTGKKEPVKPIGMVVLILHLFFA